MKGHQLIPMASQHLKLSVNDLIIKAHALALIAVPDANASWTDAGMLIHNHADIGVAVAIDGGPYLPRLFEKLTKKNCRQFRQK